MKKTLLVSLKIAIGVAVIIMVFVMFVFTQKSTELENGYMRHWAGETAERRETAVRILTGVDENIELMMACMDSIAALPDSGEMPIRDAASLCNLGIQLRDSI